jgi:hypothetical protein
VDLDPEQIDELRPLCESIARADEGGYTYLALCQVRLPDGCQPALVDALLCPMDRDGYASRLFFADRVVTPVPRNWNGTCRVLERNWQAFSWRTQKGMRLAQMMAAHMKGLR